MYMLGVEAPGLRAFPAKGYSYPTAASFRLKKGVAAKVINQVCQPDIERGAFNAYGAHRQTMHGHGHISEYVFDTTTNFGFTTVILFLLLSQGLVAVAFLTNLVADVLGQFLANVSTVGVCGFVLLVAVQWF